MGDILTGGDAISGDRLSFQEINEVKNHFYGPDPPAAAVAGAVAGVLWVDSDDDRVYRYDGANWVVLGPDVDGNWIPTMTFGGAAVGPITYNAAQTLGRYSLKGNWCFFSGRLTLTSKGTSVGDALIESLPYTVKNYEGAQSACSFFANKVAFANQLQAFVPPNQDWINIYELTEVGVLTRITNVEFADDSDVIFSGMYEIEPV